MNKNRYFPPSPFSDQLDFTSLARQPTISSVANYNIIVSCLGGNRFILRCTLVGEKRNWWISQEQVATHHN
ncbi:hypothetical protein K1Y78_63115, partial [Streptomyces sp. tea 10]|nr:hypothetical protein [Streptomyces sp. tea 10]